ncbi:MAG: hypothetical protein R2778_12170 [Saprospiraceae bacterium]
MSSDGKLFYFQTAQSNPTALSANAKLPSNKPAVSEWKEENDWKVWKYEEISGKPEYPGGEDEMDAFFKNNLQTLPGIEKVEPAKKDCASALCCGKGWQSYRYSRRLRQQPGFGAGSHPCGKIDA